MSSSMHSSVSCRRMVFEGWRATGGVRPIDLHTQTRNHDATPRSEEVRRQTRRTGLFSPLPLLVLLAGCSPGFLLDAAPSVSAKSVVYFVHDDEQVISATMVARESASAIAELRVPGGSSFRVTALTYSKRPSALGFVEGELISDPGGVALPSPDGVAELSLGNGLWRDVVKLPRPVALFRVGIASRGGCAPRRVVSVPAPTPPLQSGPTSYGDLSFALAPDAAVIYFAVDRYVVFRSDLSYSEVPHGSDDLFPTIETGTVALGYGLSPCLTKQREGESSMVAMEPWRCEIPRVEFAPGNDGEFAGVRSDIVVYNRAGRERLRYGLDTFAKRTGWVLQNDDVFGIGWPYGSSSDVVHASPSGVALERTNQHGEGNSLVVVVNGHIVAGGNQGSAFERGASGEWAELGKPNGSGTYVSSIKPTPRGFVAEIGGGEIAEYVDGYGWCPPQRIWETPVYGLVRLSSGYLLYSGSSRLGTLSTAWIDFGL